VERSGRGVIAAWPTPIGRPHVVQSRRSACYWVDRISLSSRSFLSTLNTPNVARATVSAFRRSTSELTTRSGSRGRSP
jgi:hypothetical protein